MSSGKEEGEASSESDSEAVNSKTPPSATQSPHVSEGISEKRAKSPPSDSSHTRSKSKKRKRHSNKKKSHSKKSKEKAKKKKEKKLKAQKKKQTFHWQPPLEFGEDDEEETVVGNVDVLSNPKELLLENPSPEPKITPNGSLQTDKPNAQPNKVPSGTSTLKSEKKNGETLSSLVKSPLTAAKVSSSEDIKTFTSHRSLPKIKPETTNAFNNAPTTQTAAAPEKTTPPSTAAPSVAENVQGKEVLSKEEQSTSTQSAVPSVPSSEKTEAGGPETSAVDNKWKPVQGPTAVQPAKSTTVAVAPVAEPEKKPQGLRIEIKSKNKVKPGSLFDEVRKTARLNQRPRNKEESSSEERSSSHGGKSRSGSKSRFRSKSRSASSRRSRSQSYSRSGSRSQSYSSSSRSRSYTRSQSRRRYSRYRSRTRSRSYGSYRSHSRSYSRSRSRSPSYHRGRSRSRSYTYDSHYSRSRSRSRSATYRRSRSYDRRSRSRRSSYSGSDRSYSRRRR